MAYLAVKLNDTNYLGTRRGETVDNITNARCYKSLSAANKAAAGYRDVPWFSDAKVVARVTVSSEFGGSWIEERAAA
jgi:hypothetical protein